MGNASWMQAVVLGIAWSSFMTFQAARGKTLPNLGKVGVGYFMYGLCLGLLLSFGWHALAMPVVLVAVPSAGCGLFLLWSARLKMSAKA